MKGTILNTATVTVGSLIGLSIGKLIPISTQEIALNGLALVTIGIGLKLFLSSKNTLIVAAATAIGGVLGHILGINAGMQHLSEWVQQSVGGGGHFSQGLVTACILYCVGPMTLLGCLQDRLEGKSELLAVKSTMDGVASIFLAATFGIGVLFSAPFVLVFQGLLTLAAKPLAPLRNDEELLAEVTGAGGPIMMAIGLSVLQIKVIPTADYVPSLLIAPLLVVVSRKVTAVLQSRRG